MEDAHRPRFGPAANGWPKKGPGRGVRSLQLAQHPTKAPLTGWPLVSVNRTGLATPLTDDADYYVFPRLSPDGTRLAVAIGEQAFFGLDNADVWLFEIARGARSRLTFDGTNLSRYFPTWTPDGRRVVYATGTPSDLSWTSADGTGQSELCRRALELAAVEARELEVLPRAIVDIQCAFQLAGASQGQNQSNREHFKEFRIGKRSGRGERPFEKLQMSRFRNGQS